MVDFPLYWLNLIDGQSITVQLTPTRLGQELALGSTSVYGMFVENPSGNEFHYFVQATRKDQPPLIVEPT